MVGVRGARGRGSRSRHRGVGSDRTARVTGEPIWLGGWAVDPVAQQCPAALLIDIDDGRIVLPALVGGERPDVAAALRVPAYRRSGFVAVFSSDLLPPGPHTIRFT